MEPVSGFWGNLSYDLFGRNYSQRASYEKDGEIKYLNVSTTYPVNKEGKISGPGKILPLTGTPMIPSMAGGVSLLQMGKNFGKLGTVVNNPAIKISSVASHGLNQAITRGVSPSMLQNTINNPGVVLQQTNGKFLYLTKEAAVVLSTEGRLVTTYPASMFDKTMVEVVKLLP